MKNADEREKEVALVCEVELFVVIALPRAQSRVSTCGDEHPLESVQVLVWEPLSLEQTAGVQSVQDQLVTHAALVEQLWFVAVGLSVVTLQLLESVQVTDWVLFVHVPVELTQLGVHDVELVATPKVKLPVEALLFPLSNATAHK
jgi:hypothetical protein